MTNRIRTMLIDDDLNLLEVVKYIVEKDGDIDISSEDNPLVALKRLETERYDIIVCDYEMPGMDGLSLLRTLRDGGNETPFIMFTGKGRDEIELDAFRSGVSWYLQKRGGSLAIFAELQNAIRQGVKGKCKTTRYEVGLEESVRMLKSTIDCLAMGVMVLSFPESHLLYFNQMFLDMWGLDEKEMHLPHHDFVSLMIVKAADQEKFQEELEQVEGNPMMVSMSVVDLKDGRSMAWTSAPMLCEGGLVGRVLTFRNDPSIKPARVNSDRPIHPSNIDVNRDLVVNLNSEGRIIFASPSFEAETGQSARDMMGRLATEFVHPDDAPRLRENWFKMIGEKVFGSMEYRFRKKDGGYIWLSTNGYFSYGMTGEVSGGAMISRDITLRKKAEEELIESEGRYRQLVELAQGGIVMLDRDAHASFVNDYFANMVGRGRDEIIGKDITLFISPEWILRNGGIIEHIGQPRSSFDVDLQRPDGTVVHSHSDFCWIIDELREITGHMGFLTDISPRIKAEAELKESEQKFRAFVEESAEGVAISDENGLIVEWNKSLERIMDIPRKDVLGSSIFDFWKKFSKEINEDDSRDLQERLDALVQHGKWHLPNEPRNFTFVTPSGNRKILHILVFPFRTIKGHCASVLINDVTETSRIEQERADAQQRYRSIFENAKEIIITLDNDGHITAANQAAGAYMGRPLAELVGMHLEKFIGSSYHEIFDKTFSSWDPRPHTGEADVIVRGERKVLELSCSPMVSDGTVVGVQCIGRDVTGRRQVEMAMDLATRKISLLGDITRHDVMNKLAVISGYVELARKEQDPQKRMDHLGKVEQATHGIQEQMMFNKRYQALGSNRPQWTKLRSVCLNRVRLVDLKDILMEIDVDDVEIYADPMFESVIGNLLDNSIKHGGKVSHIKIGYRHEKEGLVVLYQDNGTGLSPADKRNIFNWDFRGRSGHGLHFISEVLLITGITITEDGEYGKGAHFNIRIPKEGFRLNDQEAPMDAPSWKVNT